MVPTVSNGKLGRSHEVAVGRPVVAEVNVVHLFRLVAIEGAVYIGVVDAVLTDTHERVFDELQSVSHVRIEAARPFSRRTKFNLIGRCIWLRKKPWVGRLYLIDSIIAFEQIVLVSRGERRSVPQAVVRAASATVAVRLPVCLDAGTCSVVIEWLLKRGLVV